MALNQFAQSVAVGMVDQTILNNILTVRLNKLAPADLDAGAYVALSPGVAGKVPVVVAGVATAVGLGVIVLDPLSSLNKKGRTMSVAAKGSVIYVKVNEAVQRDDKLTLNGTGYRKMTGTDVAQLSALDIGAGANAIIRAVVL